MSWVAINPNKLLPSALVQAVSAASDAISSTLAEAAGALTLPSLPSLPSTDTAALVINTILDTISGVLKGGQIHTLIVPIVKTVSKRTPTLPPTLEDLQDSLNITLGPNNTVVTAADAYTEMVTKQGGNAGFFSAFAESLMNATDPNRPQYDSQNDAVAMTVLLVGAPRYAAIAPAASTLDILFAPKGDNGVAARTVPVPQNLTARVVGSTIAPGIGVRLDWDKPASKFVSQFFPGVATAVTRYAIIRSTDVKAQNARTVLDFFTTQTLSVGMSSGSAKVIAVGSGKNAAYLDTEAMLDPKIPAYYCVAWECSISETGVTTTLPFDKVSNIAKAVVIAPTPPQTGRSPVWTATPKAIEAFPAVGRAADRMIEQTRVLLTPSGDSTSRLKGAMQLTVDASNRLSKKASSMVDDVKRFSSALSRVIPSMYVTQMSSATGGNTFLMAELSKRLGDTSDASRPPFDNGEYVCGVCFVAGASRLADLASVVTFFNTLFGPANATNPLLGLLASIGTAVAAAEAVVFGPDMRPLATASTTTTDSTGQPTTIPVDPITGKPAVPAHPAIANDGKAVETNSPANPNAGDTNITPPSELC